MSGEDVASIRVSRFPLSAEALRQPGVRDNGLVTSLILRNTIAFQQQGFYVARGADVTTGGQDEVLGALATNHRMTDGRVRVLDVTGTEEAQVALLAQAVHDAELFASGLIVPKEVLPEDAIDMVPDLERAREQEVLGHSALVLAFK